jgi:tetratricopeptide (TPR) repeat protein
LVGRDHELALLQQALASVLAGRGGLVSLIGEAGLGKSRLIGELQDMARAALGRPPPLWLEGRCLETGVAVSYWPFLDLLQTYLGWGSHTAEDVRGQTLAAALAGLVRDGVLAADRADEMLPVLGHLLSLERGGERGAPLAAAHPEAIKHQTFLALRDLVLALARRAPLLLVLEDLHWADGLSLDLLSLLMETATQAPLLLVCAYRPEQGHRCRHLAAVAARKCPGGYTEVRLRDLSPEHSRRLVESLLHGEALPPPVKEKILARAQGNPFFLEEIVRSLADAGLVYHDGAAWRARDKIAAVAVPESVQSVIVSRVDRLDPPAKGLLQVAAVIGRLVPRRLLVEVLAASDPASLPAEGMEVDRVLWELEDRQLIYQERAIPEEEYSFQHVLTQETVYGGILRRRRAALHGSVARAIERLHGESLDEYHEQLAHHYDRAGLPDRAVDYLLKAGEKSRRAYLNDEALAYFQRSLDLLAGTPLGGDRGDWQLAALKGLGQVERALGREPEAEAHLRRAIELGQSLGRGPRDLVPLYWWLGEGLWFQSRFDEVRRLGEEGQALLGAETASFEAALVNALLGAAYLVDPPHHADFGAAAARNAAFLESVPYSEDLRSAYVQQIIAQTMEKNPAMAMTWVGRFEAVARRHHDVLALGDAYNQESGVLSSMGDLQGALAPMQRAMALHRDRDTIHESLALIDAGAIYLALGELDAAEEHLQRGLAQWPGQRAEFQRAEAIGKLGVVALCRGALDAARAHFEEADGIFGERDNTTNTLERASMALLMARASLAQGSREETLRHAAAAIVLRKTVLEDDLHTVDAVLGAPSETRAWLERLCDGHPEVAVPAGVVWFPVAATCVPFPHHDAQDAGVEFGAALGPAWDWHDPLGGSSHSLGGGLEIRAAAGSDLHLVNVSAPRLLRPAPRCDFAVQAVCTPVPDGRPAIGGLLLWEGRGGYLVLERGRWGPHSVSFHGLREGWDHWWDRDRLIGRGCSPTDRVWLRLERRGDLVRALYSGDGTAWLNAGEVEFPAGEGAQTGLYAAGSINRAVYQGAYRDGAALRFDAFCQWSAGSG